MSNQEPKCGDGCALVEMLATKTSKEQAMENAIAAVNTGKMSAYKAAIVFGVTKSNLQKKLKNASTCTRPKEAECTAQLNPALTKATAPDDAERDQWWDDYKGGMSYSKIAANYGRHRTTITKEIKRREGAAAKSDLESKSTTESADSDHNQTFKIQMVEPDEPLTPTGQISDHTKSIIAREKKTLQDKIKLVKQFDEINASLESYYKPLQKDWQKHGRPVVLGNLRIAEKVFLRDGVLQPLAESLELPDGSSLEDCLWAMQKKAKLIEKNIRTALKFYNCILSLTEEERPS